MRFPVRRLPVKAPRTTIGELGCGPHVRARARTSAHAPRRRSGLRLAPRYDGGDAGPVTTGTGHFERAAERLDAVAETGEAAADGLARAADPIVGDLEVK